MPSENCPVSTVLENEILGELWRRGIVVWLDRDGYYSECADFATVRHSAGDFPYPVVGFRRSFLELMLELEGLQNGLDPTPLLIHMPGFTEDSIRNTPLLELYKVGFRYRRALDTLARDAATGKVPPAEINAFLADEEVTLANADEWLTSRAGKKRTGVAGVLDRTSLEVVIRELLIKDTFLSERLDKDRAEELDSLRAYLARQLGVDEQWIFFITLDKSDLRWVILFHWQSSPHFSPGFVARSVRRGAQWGLRPEGRGGVVRTTSNSQVVPPVMPAVMKFIIENS